MSSPRIAHGSLHHHGADLLPDDLEGVDYLLLDGGPVVAPAEEGPEELLDEAIARLTPSLYLDPDLKVIASLAGRDPVAAARRVAKNLSETGNADLPMGVVHGSDVLDQLEEFFAAGVELRHNASGQTLHRSKSPPRAAALALDGDPVFATSQQNARLLLFAHADLETIELQLRGELRGQSASTPLDIRLEQSASSGVLLQFSANGQPPVANELELGWHRLLDAAGLPTRDAQLEMAQSIGANSSDSANSSPRGFASYRSDSLATVREATRCLLQLRYSLGGSEPLFEVVMGPVCQWDYQPWPTSIPTDLVEWSVDVRSAKDWVE